DVVVGSRYVDGGSTGNGLTRTRARGSEPATWISRILLPQPLSDAMSGVFMLRRDLADRIAGSVAREGFKILIDILSRLGRNARVEEVPFTFRERAQGESKLGVVVTMQFLGWLVTRLSGGLLPVQFLLFALAGFTGIFVHLSVLYAVAEIIGAPFVWAQLTATVVAMSTNFLLNNWLPFAHRRLKGWRMLYGLVTFYLICSLGAVANISVAVWIYQFDEATMLAGLAGALMSSVFNYAVSKIVTWRDA